VIRGRNDGGIRARNVAGPVVVEEPASEGHDGCGVEDGLCEALSKSHDSEVGGGRGGVAWRRGEEEKRRRGEELEKLEKLFT
jgi:hypothetical protein